MIVQSQTISKIYLTTDEHNSILYTILRLSLKILPKSFSFHSYLHLVRSQLIDPSWSWTWTLFCMPRETTHLGDVLNSTNDQRFRLLESGKLYFIQCRISSCSQSGKAPVSVFIGQEEDSQSFRFMFPKGIEDHE